MSHLTSALAVADSANFATALIERLVTGGTTAADMVDALTARAPEKLD